MGKEPRVAKNRCLHCLQRKGRAEVKNEHLLICVCESTYGYKTSISSCRRSLTV